MAQRAPDGKNQIVIFPELLEEKVGNRPHAARFFLYLADVLNLEGYKRSTKGTPPFARPPLMAVILYAMYRGVFSTQGILKFAEDSIGAHWILGGMNLPSYKTIERMINALLDEADSLFTQILLICEQLSLIGKQRAYIDGVKIKANASKHKAMSYKYLTDRIERHKNEFEALYESIKDQMADMEWLSDEEMKKALTDQARKVHQVLQKNHSQALKNREQQIFNIDSEEAQEVVEIDVDALNAQSDLLKNTPPEDYEATLETLNNMAFIQNRVDTMAQAKTTLETQWKEAHGNKTIPEDKQINFTDADSCIMVTKHHGVQQCYNHFAIVDDKAHIILGTHTSNNASDQLGLIPAIQHTETVYGSLKGFQLGADAGFFSANNILYTEGKGIDYYASYPEAKQAYAKDKFAYDAAADAYRCPMGQILTRQKLTKDGQTGEYSNREACAACKNSGLCTKAKEGVRKIERDLVHDAVREKAKEKANSEEGREILRLRKSVPEPVWGNIKIQDGLTQMHYRGLNRSSLEFKLHSVMHNIRKIVKVYFNSESYQETIHQTEEKSYADTA